MPLFSSSIDSQLPINPETRKHVQRAAWRQWNRNPFNGLIFGLGLMAPILAFPWISKQLAPIHAWTGMPAFLITFAIYVIYIFTLSMIMKRWRYAPLVYAQLREAGFDVCTKCGYWLRDLDETISQCPECGCVRPETPTT